MENNGRYNKNYGLFRQLKTFKTVKDSEILEKVVRNLSESLAKDIRYSRERLGKV